MSIAGVRYVFLDRDGVLNRKLREGEYVTDWNDFEWLPGAIEAIARMHAAGLTLLLVTNQRGIALKLHTRAQLDLLHDRMQGELAEVGARLDAIYVCPHTDGECKCRKPGVGMFEQAFIDFPQANSRNSVIIGDSLADIQAGRSLGMKTIFIRGEVERQKAGSASAQSMADAVANSLLDAVEMQFDLGVRS